MKQSGGICFGEYSVTVILKEDEFEVEKIVDNMGTILYEATGDDDIID